MKEIVLSLITLISVSFNTQTTHETQKVAIPEVYNTKWASDREMVIWQIKASAQKYGIDDTKSLNIAWLESRFDPTARNGESTAKGIYQFLDGTWKNYCKGDVLNYKDNIDCFMQLYPKHPDWWITNNL